MVGLLAARYMPLTPIQLREQFFEFIFGNRRGYICLATQLPKLKESFRQHFFQWPDQKAELNSFIEEVHRSKNVWFCINPLSRSKRTKEFCVPHNVVWSDLDTTNPDKITPTPPISIQTSPGRYQGIWRLEGDISPQLAEEYSKRIAYKYVESGSDISGWDLTQLLRVPFTFNFKYEPPAAIKLLRANALRTPVSVFETLPSPESRNGQPEKEEIPLPDIQSLPEVDAVIYKYLHNLPSAFMPLYSEDPPEDADWSRMLWRLIMISFESGMNRVEVFNVALHSKVNKYHRDNRHPSYLWRDVLKAETGQKQIAIITNAYKPLAMPDLVTKEEIDGLEPTFIQDYIKWGETVTDALSQFHELSGFILLSSVLAGSLRLGTSYGSMVPNIWGLILGDSTLTRKTTAMRMAMDMVAEIDSQIILATDGSAEGLLSGLSTRPGRVSIYYKDEVSGFFDSINRKDYLAGMPETMTQLYDVPHVFTRRLRKETITITKPVFIFYGGGIRDRVYELINEEFILSGFIPRFLIVSGDTDLGRIRRTGPATTSTDNLRDAIRNRLHDLYENYNQEKRVQLGPGVEMSLPNEIQCFLTPEAWQRYGDIEELMVTTANGSPLSMMALPTFERLSRSLLKMSCLIAATRQLPNDNKIQVELQDILNAAWYIQRWGNHSIDLLQNSSRTSTQRAMDKIMRSIVNRPGINRGSLMQHHHLTKRDADEILGSLEDRGQIKIQKAGNGTFLWPI